MTVLQAGVYYYNAGSQMQDRSVVPAEGTSVEVHYWSGSDYVADTDSPITTPGTVYCRNIKLRLTSTGTFWFDDKELQSVTD